MCFFSPQQMQQVGAIAAQMMPGLGQQIAGGMQGSPPGAAPPGGPVVYRPPGTAGIGIPSEMMPGAGFPVPAPPMPSPMMPGAGAPMMPPGAGPVPPMMPPPGPPPLSPTGPPPGARPLVHRPIQGAARR